MAKIIWEVSLIKRTKALCYSLIPICTEDPKVDIEQAGIFKGGAESADEWCLQVGCSAGHREQTDVVKWCGASQY